MFGKFRVFDKECKKFVQDAEDFYLNSTGELCYISWGMQEEIICDSSRYIVQFYSSKSDKHKKEICQGDIIDCGSWHGKKEVLFEDGAFKIKGRCGQKIGFLSWAKDVEIVGNVWGA